MKVAVFKLKPVDKVTKMPILIRYKLILRSGLNQFLFPLFIEREIGG